MIRVAGHSSSPHQAWESPPPEVELRLALSDEGAALLQSISGVGVHGPEAGSWYAARLMAFIILVLEQLRDMRVGDAWIYGSVQDWCKQAGFSSPVEFKAALVRLEDQGVVVAKHHVLGNDQIMYARAPAPFPGAGAKRRRCGQS